MDFKKYFISFIDSILEVDKDNKYALKYKNNAEFLKYNEISKYIYENVKFIKDIENKSYLDFLTIIKEAKDISIIPGISNNYIIQLDNDKVYKSYYDVIEYVSMENYNLSANDVSINEMEKDIAETKEEIIKEIEKNKNKEEPDNMFDAVLNMIDTDALNDKIKNLTPDDLNKMSDQVTKILGGNESSKLIGDMVQTIGSELQSQTLEGGKLSEQIKSIADKVSDAYINGTKKTTNKEIEELYQNTQKFANNFTNQPLNANMINNMLKQYGIDKTLTEDDINKACQQMGIKKDQLNNVMQNSNQGMNRKTRRIIQQSTDKNGNIHIKPKTQFKTKRK